MTLLSAMLVPHGLSKTSDGRWLAEIASLDHAVWFHRPFRADEWLLYDQESPSASRSLGLTLGRLWKQDGSLVATVAQQGLVRPLPAVQ